MKKMFFILFVCFFAVGCRKAPQKAETVPVQKAPEIKAAKDLQPLLDETKKIAGAICQRLNECRAKWSDGDCVDGMARDLFSLVGKIADNTQWPKADQCQQVLQHQDCDLIIKYRFPKECGM
ncbi:MAG: hypothetical protein A3H42_02925 [Deltaproteobacteria bacterium RIFCSPLOWO2_02_FULL_46_8]|nr:MAG: hypothetical protein A3H42_02925 [Deltaproteobacteria bacterium RIFCSPLOWO2_02_FULL_46_8]